MFFLRYLALVALAIWVGGLIALGALAAPTIFDVLETRDGAGGRELAGLLFGSVLQQQQYAAWALGAIVIISLAVRAALGPRPRRLAIRIWTVTLMLAISAALTFVIAPRIDAIRVSARGPVSLLPDGDDRKVSFGRLHGLSNGLMLLTVVAGLGLMWTETKDPH
jgi:hypothetical protein